MVTKGFTAFRALAALCGTCLLYGAAPQAWASLCDKDKALAERYEQRLRMGGTARQMNLWRAKREAYEDKFFHCRTNPDANPSIQLVSGSANSPSHKAKLARQKLRTANSSDPQLQQLVTTCNYWIESVNLSPSPDNISFRNSACSAVDRRERELSSPQEPNGNPPLAAKLPGRTLQECIKPNKLIDNEVKDCMQGQLEPTWTK